jgi:hypothetical protein
MQDLAMLSSQHQEDVAPAPPFTCSLLDLVALGPVREVVWSGLDYENRQRLRETCRSLRGEVEQSCTTLKPKRLYATSSEAESLVKLSGRLPGVQRLSLSTIKSLEVLSLDPLPSSE